VRSVRTHGQGRSKMRMLEKWSAMALMLLLGSQAAWAWKVDWSNHRRIHVTVENQSATVLEVVGSNYSCEMHKLKPFDVAPNGRGKSDFEWTFKDKATNVEVCAMRFQVKAKDQKKAMCDGSLVTSLVNVDNTVNHFY